MAAAVKALKSRTKMTVPAGENSDESGGVRGGTTVGDSGGGGNVGLNTFGWSCACGKG